MTLLAIGIGSAIQFIAQSKGIKGFFAARDAEDDLQKHYSAIAEGAEELRIHRPAPSRHAHPQHPGHRRPHLRHPRALDRISS